MQHRKSVRAADDFEFVRGFLYVLVRVAKSSKGTDSNLFMAVASNLKTAHRMAKSFSLWC